MNNLPIVAKAEIDGRIAAAMEIAERIRRAREESSANAYGAELIALDYARELGADL